MPREHRRNLSLAPTLPAARDAREDLSEKQDLLGAEILTPRAVAAETAGAGSVLLAEVGEQRRPEAGRGVRVCDHPGELAPIEVPLALALRGVGRRTAPPGVV